MYYRIIMFLSAIPVCFQLYADVQNTHQCIYNKMINYSEPVTDPKRQYTTKNIVICKKPSKLIYMILYNIK